MVGQLGELMDQGDEASRTHPSGFAMSGILSMLLRELIAYALRKGPPATLGATLGVTDEQAQVIRTAVLRAELARESE